MKIHVSTYSSNHVTTSLLRDPSLRSGTFHVPSRNEDSAHQRSFVKPTQRSMNELICVIRVYSTTELVGIFITLDKDVKKQYKVNETAFASFLDAPLSFNYNAVYSYTTMIVHTSLSLHISPSSHPFQPSFPCICKCQCSMHRKPRDSRFATFDGKKLIIHLYVPLFTTTPSQRKHFISRLYFV